MINLRGHEELFFEFAHGDKRWAFATLLESRREEVCKKPNNEASISNELSHGALIFDDFESTTDAQEQDASPVMTDSIMNPMFTSASSTFLRFKPDRPLHFTFLTIGSRGDVQPYIALAKGLMADGHTCRIATHGEFQEWIESVSCILISLA